MREIDNNKPNSTVNFQGIQKPVQEEPIAEAPQSAQETKELNDLSAMPAASLGQSQVTSDSIGSDMKFLEKNPAIANAIMQAVDKYAETHTEDETLQMLEKAHQEFVSKK
jgi:hypothetical protein